MFAKKLFGVPPLGLLRKEKIAVSSGFFVRSSGKFAEIAALLQKFGAQSGRKSRRNRILGNFETDPIIWKIQLIENALKNILLINYGGGAAPILIPQYIASGRLFPVLYVPKFAKRRVIHVPHHPHKKAAPPQGEAALRSACQKSLFDTFNENLRIFIEWRKIADC